MTPLPATSTGWRPFIAAVIVAVATVAICYIAAPSNLAAAPPAQTGTLSMEISKRLQGSDVIQVGQELTFTIRITNTGTISITTLPLIDEYESSILQLERTIPLSSTNIVTPATGEGLITWSDLTTDTVFGPLNPGQSIEIITVFRAIAPRVVTVNRARIGAAVGFGGQEYAGDGRSSTGDAIGGQVIVRKELVTDTVAASGLPLTFTITISNDGAADLTRIPLRDTFDLTYLQFASAIPTPTLTSTSTITEGVLEWDNVLTGLGLTRLRPGEIITVTTVFTALRSVEAALINRAEASGVRDEFDDEVQAPRQAEVPIRIIPGPAEATPTSTPTPTSVPREEPQPRDTPVPATPTATPTPTAENTATPTPETAGVAATPTVAAPATLPRTGGSDHLLWAVIAALLLAGAALALRFRPGL
ncbi:MAG: LPXTG cell wall anchor domain-containing protein [Roseiflexus sp.]|jgi:LPXTG-motif cell wall-anchored protein|nr:LPXTG cell wall anchor domain-containing protein [Roseiflexus sp.]MBO9363907.1 LPXTG cell wall anchor domain-containing protein [Roseiflexus sp.]MBO9382179.1 LPXTG cell wall anchor domain-containing protein [Roseiflexus sp.]MBO9389528.1 LPXTG cell wall anchor domain-containing protein [Roseiflexus sp.]